MWSILTNMTNLTKQNIQERIKRLILEYDRAIEEEDPTAKAWLLKEFNELISDVVKEIIGEKEGNDQEEFGADYTEIDRNNLRSEQEAKRKEVLG